MPKIQYTPVTLRGKKIDQITTANAIIDDYTAQGFRLTLRQLYYQFVARGLIENTPRSYDNLGYLINEGRLQGLIDWDAIEDRTRSLSSLSTWSTPAEIVAACANQFRLDLWRNQPTRLEVWVEKEALAGVIESACNALRVPFLSCRGYTSQSEMHAAAMRLKTFTSDQRVAILHLGDHDPSGIDMSRDIQARLALFMGARATRKLTFTRCALNMDQVKQYNPPPNPAKTTDCRFKAYSDLYGDESWELDALEPAVLTALIQRHIKKYRDDVAWDSDVVLEQKCRRELRLVSDNWSTALENLDVDSSDDSDFDDDASEDNADDDSAETDDHDDSPDDSVDDTDADE